MSLDTADSLVQEQQQVRVAREGQPAPQGQCVLYWMQRAQRALDNPALNYAIELGNALERPVIVGFALTADYPGAQRRHYRFLVEGLADLVHAMKARRVVFVVRLGSPEEVVPALVRETGAAIVVGDENPLRVGREWRRRVQERLDVPLRFVDADVVVPSSLFPKLEFAARTIRPKLHRLLGEYFQPVANPRARVAWAGDHPHGEVIEPDHLIRKLKVGGVTEVAGYLGGTSEAIRRLGAFVAGRLPVYNTERNDPEPYRSSELSAHLHFGHIGPHTVAIAVRQSDAPQAAIDVFLEELIVRRELAVNFAARNPDHDRLEGGPEWGLRTLAKHAQDPRPMVYDATTLEAGQTHDPIWNAAQREMVLTGRMHNYLRMYWAKKILEWSPDPQTAFQIAVDLNDRYEMDGRDPSGYTGISWALTGRHDRPWGERPIFGTIRYMSQDGIRRKLEIEPYLRRIRSLEES